MTEKQMMDVYPEVYSIVSEMYDDEMSWREKLYCYIHDISCRPVCKVCGKKVKFKSFKSGYHQYCSRECMYKDPERMRKIMNTQKERYGGVGFASDVLMEKTKKTNVERYGSDCPLQSDQIKEKIKETNLKKYGSENPMCNNDIALKAVETQKERYGGVGFASDVLMEKTKKTNVERYGSENPMYNEKIRIRARNNELESFLLSHEDVIARENGMYTCRCPHPDCSGCIEKTYTISTPQYWVRINQGVEPCTRLYPVGYHNQITSIESFCHRVLDENNINYECNIRTLLDGKEIDVYVPSHSLAIECNGIYWHSDEKVDEMHHYNKWKMCRERKIRLLILWEDWIRIRPDVVKSIILSACGIHKEIVDSHDCTLKDIHIDECNTFLEKNDVYGGCDKSDILVGLYRDGDLLGAMVFSKIDDDQWILEKYCCQNGIYVINGMSEMFDYFVEGYHPERVVSFSSNDISDESELREIGFKMERDEGPSRWWVDNKTFMRTKEESSGLLQIHDSGWMRWVKQSQI